MEQSLTEFSVYNLLLSISRCRTHLMTNIRFVTVTVIYPVAAASTVTMIFWKRLVTDKALIVVKPLTMVEVKSTKWRLEHSTMSRLIDSIGSERSEVNVVALSFAEWR